MRKLFLPLTILLLSLSTYAAGQSSSDTTSKVGTTPNIYDMMLFNLCYNSLEYMTMYANELKELNVQKDSVITGYQKVTGISVSSVKDLERIYQLKVAEDMDKNDNNLRLEKELKKSNRSNKLWKVGTFVLLPPAIVGVTAIAVKLSK